MDQSLWQTPESIDFIYSSYEWIQTILSCGNTAKQCRLGLFQDSDFAGDLEDSKSTSGGTLCVFGRSLIWWEDTIWKAVRNAFWRTSSTVWSNGLISPNFCERPIWTASVWSKSLARFFPWLCIVCGVNSRKETFWSQTLKNWRRWTHLNATPEGSMQRKC